MPTFQRTATRLGAASLTFALVIFGLGFQSRMDLAGTLSADSQWFLHYDFDPATFQKPPIAFGPYARWWWPGNDVTKAELQREINGFGDDDVQTLAPNGGPFTRPTETCRGCGREALLQLSPKVFDFRKFLFEKHNCMAIK